MRGRSSPYQSCLLSEFPSPRGVRGHAPLANVYDFDLQKCNRVTIVAIAELPTVLIHQYFNQSTKLILMEGDKLLKTVRRLMYTMYVWIIDSDYKILKLRQKY